MLEWGRFKVNKLNRKEDGDDWLVKLKAILSFDSCQASSSSNIKIVW